MEGCSWSLSVVMATGVFAWLTIATSPIFILQASSILVRTVSWSSGRKAIPGDCMTIVICRWFLPRYLYAGMGAVGAACGVGVVCALVAVGGVAVGAVAVGGVGAVGAVADGIGALRAGTVPGMDDSFESGVATVASRLSR